MSLLDLASLVLAPTATKEGKVYSAIPDTGDGDMTFTRGSSATRINSAGLIEKERGNRLLQSNNFNTSPYSPAFATVTSGFEGYDGSNDAWKVASTTIGSETRIRQSQTFTTGEVITLSVYMKKGNVNYGIVRTYAITGGGRAWFDLENGTVATENSGINGSIEDVGNGWYRCSIWGVIDTTGAVDIAPAPSDGDYLADAVGEFIYIQDSMLNQGLVAQSYIETTTSAVYEGITDDVPRVDYSGGGCPSLLLESQRTNLFPQSEYLKDTTHWQVTNVSFSVNQGTSPEGQNNAIKVVPNSTGAAFWLDDTTLTSGQPYVLSFYAKSNGWDYLQVTNSSGVGGTEKENFDIINGTSNGDYATGDAVIQEFGNGWYKIIVKGTANASTGRMVIALSSGLTMERLGSVTPSGDDGVLLYGFQWEQGSYSTSYIPTYSVSSTRVADSCSKTGISELIGQTEGTLFVEFEIDRTPSETARVCILSNGTANERIGISCGSSGLIYAFVVDGGSTTAEIISRDNTSGTYKVAFAYANNDFVFYNNSTQVGTDTSGTVSSCNQIELGSQFNASYLGGGVKQAILFPTRLTNDQLEELTK